MLRVMCRLGWHRWGERQANEDGEGFRACGNGCGAVGLDDRSRPLLTRRISARTADRDPTPLPDLSLHSLLL